MRAAGVNEYGGPDALQVLDVPEPQPGPGEVRIGVRAASVVAADGLFRSGALAGRISSPAPWIPGTEVAGVIEDASDSDRWKVGDEVFAIVVPWHQRPGGYAESVIVPAASVAALPVAGDFAAAATLPMCGLTASALLERLDLNAGQRLAVTGAGGVVGGFLTQLARRAGITVVSDAPGGDYEIGRDGDYVAQIRSIFPAGVDALADAAIIGESLVGAVRDGGRFASLRAIDFALPRDISAVGVSVWEYAEDSARLAELSELVRSGELSPPAVRHFALSDVAAAHETLGQRGHVGRGVIIF